ncbi:unnamed protein product [Caenorhabditis sp. 36 PRJEB53466]|nr:unnamed protein product [Caenorhabditis sp. 36 PRJEB53466]
MKSLAVLAIFAAVLYAECASWRSDDSVAISGSFQVAAKGEQLPENDGFVTEHPFFQLEGMKIARAYLDRQYAKERADQKLRRS